MTSRVYWILKIVNKQSFLILIYVDKISSYDTEQYVFQTIMNAILYNFWQLAYIHVYRYIYTFNSWWTNFKFIAFIDGKLT